MLEALLFFSLAFAQAPPAPVPESMPLVPGAVPAEEIELVLEKSAVLNGASNGFRGLSSFYSEGVNENFKLPSIGLRGTGTYPWPDEIHDGFWPFQLSVSNEWSSGRDLRIRGNSFDAYDVTVSADMNIPAGDTAEIELMIPSFKNGSNNWRFELFDENGVRLHSFNLGPYYSIRSKVPSVLTVMSESQKKKENPWSAAAQASWTRKSGNGAVITPDKLPKSFIAYSSLSMVVVMTDEDTPSKQQMDVLGDWVRLGGVIVFSGLKAESFAKATFPDWVNPRFSQKVDLIANYSDSILFSNKVSNFIPTYSPKIPLSRGLKKWSMGRGDVYVDNGNIPIESAFSVMFNVIERESPHFNNPHDEGRSSLRLDIPGLENAHRRRYVGILFLLAFLMIPVNLFWALRRWKISSSLLFTTPILGFSASILVLIYGFLIMDKTIQVARFQFNLLDQRNKKNHLEEINASYVSMRKKNKLNVPANYWLQPFVVNKYNHISSSSKPTYGQFYTKKGTIVTGDLLPGRNLSSRRALHVGMSRLRLDVQGTKITNALGTKIKSLYYRDDVGNYWIAENVPEGGTAELKSLVKSDAPQSQNPSWRLVMDSEFGRPYEAVFNNSKDIPLRSYLANLKSSPFTELDLEVSTVREEIWVLGVLE